MAVGAPQLLLLVHELFCPPPLKCAAFGLARWRA